MLIVQINQKKNQPLYYSSGVETQTYEEARYILRSNALLVLTLKRILHISKQCANVYKNISTAVVAVSRDISNPMYRHGQTLTLVSDDKHDECTTTDRVFHQYNGF